MFLVIQDLPYCCLLVFVELDLGSKTGLNVVKIVELFLKEVVRSA